MPFVFYMEVLVSDFETKCQHNIAPVVLNGC